MRASGEHYAPGEVVSLLRPVRVADQVHDVGTRARVLADHGAVVVLHLCTSSAEIVTCPTDHVRRSVELSARTPASRAA
jgi:hypothetical protein